MMSGPSLSSRRFYKPRYRSLYGENYEDQNRRITRSMSKLPPPPSRLSGRKRKVSSQWEEYQKEGEREVLAFIARSSKEKPKKLFVDFSNGPIPTHPPEYEDVVVTKEYMKSIGVLYASDHCAPLSPEDDIRDAPNQTMQSALLLVVRCVELPQADIISLSLTSCWLLNMLEDYMPLWKSINLVGMDNAGDRLVAATSLARYHNNVEHINLQCAQDIEDKHLTYIGNEAKFDDSLEYVESLNLDHCRKISSRGIKDITTACPLLRKFSISGSSRVTDFGIKSLVKNCEHLVDLNLSGCKNITDKGLISININCPNLKSLDISCCERVTDAGVKVIADGCPYLESLSLYGIPGVTDRCLKTLSKNCLLTAIDVRSSGIVKNDCECKLRKFFPILERFIISTYSTPAASKRCVCCQSSKQ